MNRVAWASSVRSTRPARRTQHLYTYVGNNPVNMVDPTGHIATEDNFDYKKPVVPKPNGHSFEGLNPWKKPESEYTPTGSDNGNGTTSESWLDSTDPLLNFEIPTIGGLLAPIYSSAEEGFGLSNGYLIPEKALPKRAKVPKHYMKDVKTINSALVKFNNIAYVMTGVYSCMDVLNALTADNGNTNRQRLQKIGIDLTANIVGIAGGVVGSAVAVASVAAAPESLGASIGGVGLGVGIIGYVNYNMGTWSDSMYDILEINH